MPLNTAVISFVQLEDPPVLQSFLSEQAKTAVKGLLPGWAGGDLAETCSWADQQRFRYRWSSPLHFADTPGDCKFDYASKPLPDSDQHCSMQSCCFGIQNV